LLEFGKGTSKKDLLATLSPRQREVLRLIAEGLTTKQIAQTLEISVKTVESHRSQLMERLGIHEVAGLVRYAIIVGLIDVES
jgi:DNA-binding NarL/FixJ family response regulator